MIPTTRLLVLGGAAALIVLSLAACGSDEPLLGARNDGSIPDLSDISIPDFSIPDASDMTVPDFSHIGDDCQALIAALGAASQAISGQGDPDLLEAALNKLVDAVPDELKDDAETFAEAYGNFLTAVIDSGKDFSDAFSDPDVQAAMQAMSDPDVAKANENITAYLDDSCQS